MNEQRRDPSDVPRWFSYFQLSRVELPIMHWGSSWPQVTQLPVFVDADGRRWHKPKELDEQEVLRAIGRASTAYVVLAAPPPPRVYKLAVSDMNPFWRQVHVTAAADVVAVFSWRAETSAKPRSQRNAAPSLLMFELFGGDCD
jgi:hypothetical protein